MVLSKNMNKTVKHVKQQTNKQNLTKKKAANKEYHFSDICNGQKTAKIMSWLCCILMTEAT